jgi:hypothetical protein
MGLMASVAVSYILLTFKKPTDFSHYGVSWIPILLLPIAFVFDSAGRRARLFMVIALLVVILFNVAVSLRPMHKDNPHLRAGPIEFVPRVDHHITLIPRLLNVRDQAPFESWSLGPLTEAFLNSFPDRIPRITTLHPILNGANVQWEAGRRRREVRECAIPWEEIFRGTATGDFLLRIDAVIVDGHNPLLWKESVMAFLRRAGLAVEIGLEHVVFEDRDPVSLLIIRRPWEREACYPLHEWSHPKKFIVSPFFLNRDRNYSDGKS